ncbi:MAG: siderophore-interacting protein [Corynebacterium sp.]|uniref:siderophore-interacting protein n=1 Tax=Corynebacterium sp. TaxID=1720 RepID=UPI0026DA7DC6|nr:siderophore-interacting protein [Corynebacterium sp.]MDO5099527.1 siderophore-interacting protein [Corynebacterium sp.]
MYQPMRAQVSNIIRLSPNFVRIYFSGPELANVDTTEPIFDRRVKLLFPNAHGELPEFNPIDPWYHQWQELPATLQPPMRSYSIREIRNGVTGIEIAIDFVLHSRPGAEGPASAWAEAAQFGDSVVIVGPKATLDPGRPGEQRPGIEFQPATASHIVLVGDETAVPAIGRILEDLNNNDNMIPEVTGMVFMEVPQHADFLPLQCPPGFSLQWFHREHQPHHGEQLIQAICAYMDDLGIHTLNTPPIIENPQPTTISGSPELVWETPTYSAAGDDITAGAHSPIHHYFWIAGESGVVTKIRRKLVRDFHIPRHAVAFMGYWKIGRAMG